MDKFCVVCGKELIGLQRTLCSVGCRRERKREYYQNNWEKILKRRKEDYQKNPEKYRERRRKGYWNNREKELEYNRKYRHKNKERLKEYRHKNKERLEEYHQNNLEAIRGHKRAHYRRVRGLPEDWDLSRESSIETIMKRWLQESDIEFVHHYYIDLKSATRTWVDFFIPEANVCLYCDGDYWHGPERSDIQERDARNNKALERMGYSVVRMTETEILEGNRPWWIGELISSKW